MSFALWISFLSYTLITAISPGPNNILALNSVCNYGLKQSFRLILGIFTGFACVIGLSGIVGAVFSGVLPSIVPYMKYLGFAYILWLAWHIATSKPPDESTGERVKTSFLKGFILQFVNAKIILAGFMSFTTFVFPYYSSPLAIVGFTGIITLIGCTCIYIWAIAGAVLSGILRKYWRSFNIAMALLLVYSAVGLIM